MEIWKTLLPFSVFPLHFDNMLFGENLLSASTFHVLKLVSNKDSTVFNLLKYFNLNRSTLVELELTTETIDKLSY